ncbi:hypothetical protein BDV95DRAFT_590364 [Massariosphaeria phaeospora]|uniref:Uncharacterized protein n=1 Tax=Massariosphaeria phaeospora TaxID=100035 RepID=A0A7C8IMP9_9PLEO|nr:hypothetical protein BDV95DRAFT_590364 [Massariosphaeria phaeospora]
MATHNQVGSSNTMSEDELLAELTAEFSPGSSTSTPNLAETQREDSPTAATTPDATPIVNFTVDEDDIWSRYDAAQRAIEDDDDNEEEEDKEEDKEEDSQEEGGAAPGWQPNLHTSTSDKEDDNRGTVPQDNEELRNVEVPSRGKSPEAESEQESPVRVDYKRPGKGAQMGSKNAPVYGQRRRVGKTQAKKTPTAGPAVPAPAEPERLEQMTEQATVSPPASVPREIWAPKKIKGDRTQPELHEPIRENEDGHGTYHSFLVFESEPCPEKYQEVKDILWQQHKLDRGHQRVGMDGDLLKKRYTKDMAWDIIADDLQRLSAAEKLDLWRTEVFAKLKDGEIRRAPRKMRLLEHEPCLNDTEAGRWASKLKGIGQHMKYRFPDSHITIVTSITPCDFLGRGFFRTYMEEILQLLKDRPHNFYVELEDETILTAKAADYYPPPNRGEFDLNKKREELYSRGLEDLVQTKLGKRQVLDEKVQGAWKDLEDKSKFTDYNKFEDKYILNWFQETVDEILARLAPEYEKRCRQYDSEFEFCRDFVRKVKHFQTHGLLPGETEKRYERMNDEEARKRKKPVEIKWALPDTPVIIPLDEAKKQVILLATHVPWMPRAEVLERASRATKASLEELSAECTLSEPPYVVYVPSNAPEPAVEPEKESEKTQSKTKRGRPKGSKNRKNAASNEEPEGNVDTRAEVSKPSKRKRASCEAEGEKDMGTPSQKKVKANPTNKRRHGSEEGSEEVEDSAAHIQKKAKGQVAIPRSPGHVSGSGPVTAEVQQPEAPQARKKAVPNTRKPSVSAVESSEGTGAAEVDTTTAQSPRKKAEPKSRQPRASTNELSGPIGTVDSVKEKASGKMPTKKSVPPASEPNGGPVLEAGGQSAKRKRHGGDDAEIGEQTDGQTRKKSRAN